jgi:hypothetical protein
MGASVAEDTETRLTELGFRTDGMREGVFSASLLPDGNVVHADPMDLRDARDSLLLSEKRANLVRSRNMLITVAASLIGAFLAAFAVPARPSEVLRFMAGVGLGCLVTGLLGLYLVIRRR